eukprot:9748491-Ditylum_brightwellii.AAC.1
MDQNSRHQPLWLIIQANAPPTPSNIDTLTATFSNRSNGEEAETQVTMTSLWELVWGWGHTNERGREGGNPEAHHTNAMMQTITIQVHLQLVNF